MHQVTAAFSYKLTAKQPFIIFLLRFKKICFSLRVTELF